MLLIHTDKSHVGVLAFKKSDVWQDKDHLMHFSSNVAVLFSWLSAVIHCGALFQMSIAASACVPVRTLRLNSCCIYTLVRICIHTTDGHMAT